MWGNDMDRILSEYPKRVVPAHTAVVVVDMQNDFCAQGGYIDRKFGCDAAANEALARTNMALVDAARDVGTMVVWVRAIYDPKYLTAPMLTRMGAGGAEPRCEEGSWGADFFMVEPAEGEFVVDKHRYSAFSGTGLDGILREHGIRTLVVTGVATNICVDSTLRDGFNHGYYIVVPRDCVAAHDSELHEATLSNVAFLLGDVTTADELIGLWRGSVAGLKKAG